ncbi:uncharacterized protein LOC133320193 [Danaus plexippus]|uniref:uncharacterized protein LOC133320193 n=1 Tax=Danaus plexippus TaxID=13037 RepID=UPI002AB11401|nr:uncharacterized protein LOC133320193 [Danaus plexippus]
MLKQCIKILCLLIIAWVVTLFTIYKEYKTGKKILSDEQLYENSLKKFKSINLMAPFQLMGWESVGASSPHLTYRDRITAIKNKEFPLGKFGKPVFMANSIKGTLRLIIKKGWEENAFNQFVSDLIPIDRPLLDLRDKW